MADDTMFMVMPEACKIDIRLTNSGKIENLQVTIADRNGFFPNLAPKRKVVANSGGRWKFSIATAA